MVLGSGILRVFRGMSELFFFHLLACSIAVTGLLPFLVWSSGQDGCGALCWLLWRAVEDFHFQIICCCFFAVSLWSSQFLLMLIPKSSYGIIKHLEKPVTTVGYFMIGASVSFWSLGFAALFSLVKIHFLLSFCSVFKFYIVRGWCLGLQLWFFSLQINYCWIFDPWTDRVCGGWSQVLFAAFTLHQNQFYAGICSMFMGAGAGFRAALVLQMMIIYAVSFAPCGTSKTGLMCIACCRRLHLVLLFQMYFYLFFWFCLHLVPCIFSS